MSPECVSLSALVATFLIPHQVQVPTSPGEAPTHLKFNGEPRFPLKNISFPAFQWPPRVFGFLQRKQNVSQPERLGQNRELLPCISHFTARGKIFDYIK